MDGGKMGAEVMGHDRVSACCESPVLLVRQRSVPMGNLHKPLEKRNSGTGEVVPLRVSPRPWLVKVGCPCSSVQSPSVLCWVRAAGSCRSVRPSYTARGVPASSCPGPRSRQQLPAGPCVNMCIFRAR